MSERRLSDNLPLLGQPIVRNRSAQSYTSTNTTYSEDDDGDIGYDEPQPLQRKRSLSALSYISNHSTTGMMNGRSRTNSGLEGRDIFRTNSKGELFSKPPSPPFFLNLTIGIINSVMCVPVLYGYSAIIFGSPEYAPSAPALAKLVLLSSAIHQLCFSSLSTLPFAVGQVQDASLIFLARITANIAERLQGEEPAVIVSTAVTTTALCTATLGLCLVAIGKAKLAKFVAYLPMPVVGGYLAFIGYFCLEAGMTLCTGEYFSALKDWLQFKDTKLVILALPAVLGGAAYSFFSRFNHFAALPLSMVAVPALFYIGLGMSGHNLESARSAGFLGEAREAAHASQVFKLFDFSLVRWDAIPYQIPVWLSMVIVVVFSSSLDIAAIELDMGEPLDTNAELTTVGWSNCVAGLAGGFPGSYIFSQTIFTYRSKCRSRAVGLVVFVAELAVFFMDVDPLMYVPLFFFSSTLIFIAFELFYEWFIMVRSKLDWVEYLILIATFVLINILGLNKGLAAGLVLSLLSFVISYASLSMHTMQRVYKCSRVIRPASQRRLLAVHRDKIMCIELRGELFFGSAIQVLSEVKGYLGLPHEPGPDVSVESTPVSAFNRSVSGYYSTIKNTMKNCFKKRSKSDEYLPLSTSINTQNSTSYTSTAGESLSITIHEKKSDTYTSIKDNEVISPDSPTPPSGTFHKKSFQNAPGVTNTLSVRGSDSKNSGASSVPIMIRGRKGSSTRKISVGDSPLLTEEFILEEGEEWSSPSSVHYGSIGGINMATTAAFQQGAIIQNESDTREKDNLQSEHPARVNLLPSSQLFSPLLLGQVTGDNTQVPIPPVPPTLQLQGDGLPTHPPPVMSPTNVSISSRSNSLNNNKNVLPPGNLNSLGVPSFVIFDCSRLTKIDASAARSCFLQLQRLSIKHAICIVYARLTPAMESLLRAHGALEGERVGVYPTIYSALAWCEETLIKTIAPLHNTFPQRMLRDTSKGQSFMFHMGGLTLGGILAQMLDLQDPNSEFDGIEEYADLVNLPQGEQIFSVGEIADFFVILLEGDVGVAPTFTERNLRREPSLDFDGNGKQTNIRILLGPGAIFGYVDYELERERNFSCFVVSQTCSIAKFTRQGMDAMTSADPRMSALLQRCLLKHAVMELANYCT